MRADRLISLLLLLQTRGRMTAQALAENLEVSERTIYRDIEALSFAGIPLYTERGPGGGCELLDGYQTRLTGLTEPEVRALFLLDISISLADLGLDQAREDALLKISAALPAPSREQATQMRQRIYLDTRQPTHPRLETSHLKLIQEAIWHDYTLHLTYRGSPSRFIDPYGLVRQGGTWYLVGSSSGTMQVVCITHIQAAELTEQHFSRPTDFDLATYWANQSSLSSYQAPMHSRNNRSQKKSKMNFTVPAHRSRQSGFHTTISYNKKNHLRLPRFFRDLALSQVIVSELRTPSGRLDPNCA
ncbi:WYL domain-containing protein [Ktedonosporobacter rubrisoli]|uniref:WYL domain-containing protein n=1 Tax=Ktedonosporobacter rubrisoli TaxID=2509675 RepID=A0A4P6JQS2_KTERU|nr:WYL domain-containing protein [Ktedonosporobacter rubrisoli]QBD77530.1 WYL domain-containing protein [Ktedonosporobacter rubrisoli]